MLISNRYEVDGSGPRRRSAVAPARCVHGATHHFPLSSSSSLFDQVSDYLVNPPSGRHFVGEISRLLALAGCGAVDTRVVDGRRG